MIIKDGLVFDAEGKFTKRDVFIQGNKVVNLSESDVAGQGACSSGTEISGICGNYWGSEVNVIDATDMYVIPGLIDIHFHGCACHDFCEGSQEGLQIMADYELSQGITTICPASMTFDEEKLTKVFANAAAHDNKSGATLVGINMEGPFISPAKIGAQNPEFIHKPDVEMFNRLQKAANGLIKLVDLAPEEEGALEFIEQVSDKVNVSIAHTNADYDTTVSAFNKGANHVTHLYNAMPPFHHRKPGVIGAAADCEDVFVELIVDGIHSEGAVVRTTFKIFGDDRIVFISDSMEACGMPDGEYELGGQKVYVKGRLATLADGTIAGSVTNLMDIVRVAVKSMNVPLEKAIKCATVNPAKSIGIYDSYGSIDVGKYADIVILSKELEIVHIIKGGKVV